MLPPLWLPAVWGEVKIVVGLEPTPLFSVKLHHLIFQDGAAAIRVAGVVDVDEVVGAEVGIDGDAQQTALARAVHFEGDHRGWLAAAPFAKRRTLPSFSV